MAFKKTKQEALDLLQEKEKRLAELTEESAYAVQMVQNTIDNLQAVNSDIQTTGNDLLSKEWSMTLQRLVRRQLQLFVNTKWMIQTNLWLRHFAKLESCITAVNTSGDRQIRQ